MPIASSLFRTGYTANNWNTNSSGTGTAYSFGSNYVFNNSTTLYAKWTINQYTVSFTSNGGTSVSNITQDYNTSVVKPTDPTRLGYTFNGWYKESGLTTIQTWPFNMPDANTILYAKWTANNYNLVYETNGGSAVATLSAPYQSAISPPTPPTKTGHSFVGWFSDSGLTTAFSFTTMPFGGATIYAKWAANAYTVEFKNGDSFFAAYDMAYGTQITAPNGTPVKTAAKIRYIFLGWNTNQEATTAQILPTVPANDIVFYAIYASFASSLKINGKDVNIKLGDIQVKKIYKGEALVWEDYQGE